MIREKIYSDIKEAMRHQEKSKLETLRYIWAEIKNQEIDLKREMTEEEVIKLMQREVKRRNEAIEQFKKGDRGDLAESELFGVHLIESYLPVQMTRNEIGSVVDGVIAEGHSDFGGIMKEVMNRTGGKAEGKLVSEVVREKLV